MPARDRAEDLRRCLRGVLRQDWPALEVIVVDDASSDGTAETISREFPAVTVIRFEEPVGAAMARNVGLARARGWYVWFLDSDSEPLEPGVLRRLVETIEADPSIGAAGGEMCRDEEGRLFCRLKSVRVNGETASTDLPLEGIPTMDTDYLPTCNLLMRRELALELGGFDPAYVVLSEDKELGWRIRRRGLRNVVAGSAPVLHHVSRRARRGDLFRKLRNSTRFAIINLPWWRVVLLPLLDAVCLLSPGKLRALRRGGLSITKHLAGPTADRVARGKTPTALKLLLVGPRYLGCLVAAYAWNLYHIAASLRVRRRRPDFVDQAAGLLAERAVIHTAASDASAGNRHEATGPAERNRRIPTAEGPR